MFNYYIMQEFTGKKTYFSRETMLKTFMPFGFQVFVEYVADNKPHLDFRGNGNASKRRLDYKLVKTYCSEFGCDLEHTHNRLVYVQG